MRSFPLPRPRILAAIEAAATRRAVLLSAPCGYGMSTILRDYAAMVAPSAYVALPERTSFARFAGDLVQALAPHLPSLRFSLAGAFERALQRSDPPDTLATWFARHVEEATCTIVLDGLHHATDPQVARFVARAVERSPGGIHWTIGSETLDDLPVASWLARELTSLPLDDSVLRLTTDKAEEIAAVLAPEVGGDAVRRLHESTKGVVSDFVFLLRRPQTLVGNELEWTFEAAAQAAYDALDDAQREFVLQTALLPSLDPTVFKKAAGPEASVLFAAITEKSPEIFEPSGLHYHGRFRLFVRDKIAALHAEDRDRLFARAARALETSGDVAGAIGLFAESRNEDEILRLIDRYGFNSMESDKAYILHDALAALGEQARQANHVVLAVQAMMASLGGKMDMSEALFQHALLSCDAPQQHMRMRYLYAVDLMRRGRLDCINLLKPDAAFLEAPPEVRVAVMSALGAAHVLAGQIDIAQKWVNRALAAAETLGDNILSARVHHQAGFVALNAGDAEASKRLGTIAAELAEREGVFEVAGGAYSVLYQSAQDLEDNLEASAAHLERIAACGAKSGSVEKQLFAWLAAYEIAIERGDARAAIGIERELSEFDVQYSGRLVLQAMLPAKALQLAWFGDFARAHRILLSSAEQQESSDRQALRWVEIALYAAGAGMIEEASKAVTTAWRILKRERKEQTLRFWRARTFCALTFVLLGRLRSPRLMLNALRREIPQKFGRALALVHAVELLVERRAGARNHAELGAAIDDLRRRQSGGLARLLEALPSALVAPLTTSVERPTLRLVTEFASVDNLDLPIGETA